MNEVKVTFLGTGNAFNSDGRANLSVFIQYKFFACLLDAGPTLLYQLSRSGINPARIQQLCLSHFHGDHAAGIPFLLLYLAEIEKRSAPLWIYGPRGTKKLCRKLNRVTYPEINLDKSAIYQEFPVRLANDVSLGEDVYMDIYPMDHRPESIAYKFKIAGKTIAFSGDTRWNSLLIPLTQGADIAILECTTLERSGFCHLSFAEITENLDLLQAKQIVPVHLDNQTASAFTKQKNDKIRLMEDGDSITLV